LDLEGLEGLEDLEDLNVIRTNMQIKLPLAQLVVHQEAQLVVVDRLSLVSIAVAIAIHRDAIVLVRAM
jgi:hypothetical protein